MNKAAALLAYGAACALLLAAFSMIQDFLRYLFSLGAFLLGLRFFGQYETWGMRLGLIGLTLVFYFLFVFLYTVIAYARGWYIPGME